MNLKEKANNVKEYFSPKIIGEVNNVFIKVAKIKGKKVLWHNHKNEDELFYILEGSLEIENKSPFQMNKGDLYIVKRGVNHKVSSQKECHLMLIENKTALHPGKVPTEITKSIEEQKLLKY